MKRLDKVFNIINSKSLELINCEENDNGVLFVARTEKNNGIVARITQFSHISPMPKNAITVALGGSVLSCFLQTEPFYTSFHIACLYPKQSMTEEMMLLYCSIIEQNKYKYSFGRQANKTLGALMIPTVEEFTSWIDNNSIQGYKIQKTSASKYKLKLDIDTWKYFRVEDIFPCIEKCKCSNATEFLENGNDIAYIGAKKNENGVMKYVKYEESLVTKGNCIVFIGDGQGSVGYCTYQPNDFIGSTTLLAGYNKYLNVYVAQFLITVLDLERYRYSFGRKYKKDVIKSSRIKLPATQNGEPDWKFMENYIKSLPYSSNI